VILPSWRAVAGCLLLISVRAESQRIEALTVAVGPASTTTADERDNPPPKVRAIIDRMPMGASPLASLLIPGLGQARLRQGRAAAYLAAEAFLLLQYRKDLSEAHRNARDYREIARTIARRGFAAAPPDTIWQYYEKLTEFIESGAYSMTQAGRVVPESDSTTYNGFQWLLARRQYGVSADPGEATSAAYARALELYQTRAVQQPYRWSWRNAQLEKDLYVRTISRTNDAYRRATVDLSAVIANHLLSAIDAFAVVRLTQLPGGTMRVSASVPIR
jgi:hypothetical protein